MRLVHRKLKLFFFIKSAYYISIFAFIFLFMPGCSDVKAPVLDKINPAALPGLCLAFNCHNGTQLRIYPPVSGAHQAHMDAKQIGVVLNCNSCHGNNGNFRGGLHQNGFINGYNWLFGKKAPGNIVSFSSDLVRFNSLISFDHAASTCSGTGAACHGAASPDWYSGSACGSCHVSPPLNKFPPASGAHTIHRYKNYPCLTCHYRYTSQLTTTHNDGTVDGYIWQTRTSVAGNIVIFAASAGASAAFSHATGNCTSLGCHGLRNWYSYTSGCTVCHQYPPLNQAVPATGNHTRHLNMGYTCQDCHNGYAAGNALHNNGNIDGSVLDPKATVTGNSVIFSGGGSFTTSGPSAGNCSGLSGGCHGTENWYSGGD
jgi:hypothetical protein